MNFNCTICNREFKTKSGLWKHTVKHNIKNPTEKKVYNCRYCNRDFNIKQSRWAHEQKCKQINNIPLEEQVKKLSEEIKEIKSKPNTITNTNTNSNNTTNNIQLVINAQGSEDIGKLTFEQCKEIFGKRLNCLTLMAEKLNFNKDIPENHSYCVTAINDKHATIINPETNITTKTDKIDLFDKLLVSYLDKLEKIAKNSKFKYSERNEYIGIISKLRELFFQNKKYIKRYYTDLNYISYNNKDLIKNTWGKLKQQKLSEKLEMKNEKLGFDDLSDDSTTEDSEDELIKEKQKELKKQYESQQKMIPKHNPIIKVNSDISNSESDSDTEECEIPEIKIKGQIYLLEGVNVHVKTKKGTRGELYGTYSPKTGKVKKVPPKEIDGGGESTTFKKTIVIT
jgi:hypothetical protein